MPGGLEMVRNGFFYGKLIFILWISFSYQIFFILFFWCFIIPFVAFSLAFRFLKREVGVEYFDDMVKILSLVY
jgi:hypothetical protein